VGALLISDYHYDTVKTRIYETIRPVYQSAGLPVTLDSRFRLLEFQAPTVLTPNEPEAEGALQTAILDTPEELRKCGRHLLKKTAAQAVLLTRGSKGMVLYREGRPMYPIRIHGPSDIVDVTGAGDTVISVLTLALASGADFRDAAELANCAGGLVVMKKGTATVTANELQTAVTS
jgi:rfaE bifunctional protein kinase chain/domain